jgi:hypothetical protein
LKATWIFFSNFYFIKISIYFKQNCRIFHPNSINNSFPKWNFPPIVCVMHLFDPIKSAFLTNNWKCKYFVTCSQLIKKTFWQITWMHFINYFDDSINLCDSLEIQFPLHFPVLCKSSFASNVQIDYSFQQLNNWKGKFKI